jgi:hypothetical protein
LKEVTAGKAEEDIIEVDLGDNEVGMDWINLAQERDQCWIPMNLGVPYIARKFLTDEQPLASLEGLGSTFECSALFILLLTSPCQCPFCLFLFNYVSVLLLLLI